MVSFVPLKRTSLGHARPAYSRQPHHSRSTGRKQQHVRAVYVPDEAAVNMNTGPKLGQWTQTPGDILALGPRATAGALSSFAQLQQDLQRLNLLIQDPRPLQQKQGLIAEELQATLATYVERGAGLEAEALQSLGRSLPQELTSALPMEVQDALRGGTAPAVTTAQPGASTTPLAEQELVNPSSLVDYQVAAEMVNVKAAVEGLRDAISRLGANLTPDQEGVLQLNVRERRDALSRSISQLSPGTLSVQDGTVIAAVSEASQLLADVDTIKF